MDWGEVLGCVCITCVNYSIGQATCAVNIEAFIVFIFKEEAQRSWHAC